MVCGEELETEHQLAVDVLLVRGDGWEWANVEDDALCFGFLHEFQCIGSVSTYAGGFPDDQYVTPVCRGEPRSEFPLFPRLCSTDILFNPLWRL